jgi:hypothetical protein
MWTVTLLLFIYVDSDIVAVYEWDSGIVAVYVCGQ